MQTAREIYQDHLDVTSRALWAWDFKTVAAAMRYPIELGVGDSIAVSEDAGKMIERLQIYRESIENLAATAYHRLVKEVEVAPDNPDRIRGEHEVYVLRGATYAITPFRSSIVLDRVEGRWLCSAGQILEVPTGLRYGSPLIKSPAPGAAKSRNGDPT